MGHRRITASGTQGKNLTWYRGRLQNPLRQDSLLSVRGIELSNFGQLRSLVILGGTVPFHYDT